MPPSQQPDPIDDLLPRLRRDRPMALRTMTLADAGEEHAEIIVNLGDRAHRRAGIRAAGLLRNRDRRAKPGNQIDVRLGHLPEELAGETGKTLDVATLPLGIERIESQRTLARAADSGKANQSISGQDKTYVPQIVLSGALDQDVGISHRWKTLPKPYILGDDRGRRATRLERPNAVRTESRARRVCGPARHSGRGSRLQDWRA